MTLLELLVKELPKRGGWNINAHGAVQDNSGQVWFYKNGKPEFAGVIWAADNNSKSFDWVQWDLRFKRSEDYKRSIVTREQYEAAIAAQQPQPVWNGEGLPPIGVLVELMDDSQSQTWGNVTIKYYGDSFAVWDDNGEECSNSLCHVKVRPIFTEADHKREETVEIMRSHVTNYNKTDVVHAIEELYDAIAAGKIPGVKLV